MVSCHRHHNHSASGVFYRVVENAVFPSNQTSPLWCHVTVTIIIVFLVCSTGWLRCSVPLQCDLTVVVSCHRHHNHSVSGVLCQVVENAVFPSNPASPLWRHITVTVIIVFLVGAVSMSTDCLGIVLTFNVSQHAH